MENDNQLIDYLKNQNILEKLQLNDHDREVYCKQGIKIPMKIDIISDKCRKIQLSIDIANSIREVKNRLINK